MRTQYLIDSTMVTFQRNGTLTERLPNALQSILTKHTETDKQWSKHDSIVKWIKKGDINSRTEQLREQGIIE